MLYWPNRKYFLLYLSHNLYNLSYNWLKKDLGVYSYQHYISDKVYALVTLFLNSISLFYSSGPFSIFLFFSCLLFSQILYQEALEQWIKFVSAAFGNGLKLLEICCQLRTSYQWIQEYFWQNQINLWLLLEQTYNINNTSLFFFYIKSNNRWSWYCNF